MSDLLSTLFFTPNQCNEDMFETMWNYDSKQFIQIALYLRCHRGLKIKRDIQEQRKLFYTILRWMSRNKKNDLLKLLPCIPDLGYWKDLLCLIDTAVETEVIDLFADQLLKDYQSYNRCPAGKISLAAKWIPNEKSSFNKEHKIYNKIALRLGITNKTLRIKYLVPLRKYLLITEQLITDKKWHHINYNKVPKLSLKTHTNTFLKYDSARFKEYNITNKITENLQQIDRFLKLDLSEHTILAIETSGSMAGYPYNIAINLLNQMCCILFIPFNFDNSEEILETVLGISSTRLPEPAVLAVENFSLNNQGNSLSDCVKIAEHLDKRHLIIISDTVLSEEEYPHSDKIRITYLSIISGTVNIIDKHNLTIVEGYDNIVHRLLCNGKFIDREMYKNIIITNFFANSIN